MDNAEDSKGLEGTENLSDDDGLIMEICHLPSKHDKPRVKTRGLYSRLPSRFRERWVVITFSTFILALVTITISLAARKRAGNSVPTTTRLPIDSTEVIRGHRRTRHCGLSPKEAKARGCVFDLMEFAWVPMECHDEQLVQESLRSGPWDWYYDSNGTQPIPGGQDIDVLSLTEAVWTEARYHVTHCLYTWKRVHKFALKELPLMAGTMPFTHTHHCVEMVASSSEASYEPRNISTAVFLKYQSCIVPE